MPERYHPELSVRSWRVRSYFAESSQVLTEYDPGSPPALPPAGGPPPGGPAPPQDAIDSCNGLAEGDACQIETQQGIVDGSYAVLQGQIACRPEGGPGGQAP